MNAVLEQDEMPIRLLRTGTKVDALVKQIESHPELWDDNVFRTMGSYGNPHQKLSDIVVRFQDWSRWTGDRAAFNAQHESVWWAAYEKLPAIKPLVFDLMRLFEAEQLGMVLITKIPPHTICERHVDRGWHASFYVKFAVQLKATDEQTFCFDDVKLVTQPGDLYAFNNALPHWVENHSDEERWTLIICLRTQQPICRACHWDGT